MSFSVAPWCIRPWCVTLAVNSDHLDLADCVENVRTG